LDGIGVECIVLYYYYYVVVVVVVPVDVVVAVVVVVVIDDVRSLAIIARVVWVSLRSGVGECLKATT
jgi:hypothetical protein